MRVGPNLRTKALMALEEVLQESRGAPVDPSRAVGFALAWLWQQSGGPRDPYDEFWRALSGANSLHRFRYADMALLKIYRALGAERDEGFTSEMWRRAEALERIRRERLASGRPAP